MFWLYAARFAWRKQFFPMLKFAFSLPENEGSCSGAHVGRTESTIANALFFPGFFRMGRRRPRRRCRLFSPGAICLFHLPWIMRWNIGSPSFVPPPPRSIAHPGLRNIIDNPLASGWPTRFCRSAGHSIAWNRTLAVSWAHMLKPAFLFPKMNIRNDTLLCIPDPARRGKIGRLIILLLLARKYAGMPAMMHISW